MKCLIYESKISYDILDAAILNIAILKCKNPNYLIMNQHTRFNMSKDSENKFEENWNENVAISEYHNIPIAICDQLKDGEVDII